MTLPTSREVVNLTEKKINLPMYMVLRNLFLSVCLSVCLSVQSVKHFGPNFFKISFNSAKYFL